MTDISQKGRANQNQTFLCTIQAYTFSTNFQLAVSFFEYASQPLHLSNLIMQIIRYIYTWLPIHPLCIIHNKYGNSFPLKEDLLNLKFSYKIIYLLTDLWIYLFTCLVLQVLLKNISLISWRPASQWWKTGQAPGGKHDHLQVSDRPCHKQPARHKT